MSWATVPFERNVVFGQIGFRLVDEFTGGPLQHPAVSRLSFLDSSGHWQRLEQKPTTGPSGNLLYPRLGRSANVGSAPIVRHRVQIQSQYYRPAYLLNSDALEFDIHPYDDAHPPAVVATGPQTVMMLPSAAYSFAAFVRAVRGRTLDSLGDPVANVEVSAGAAERVLSDERGVFALPLRWAPVSGNITIDAIDHRTGRNAHLNLTLPHDLQQAQTFILT